MLHKHLDSSTQVSQSLQMPKEPQPAAHEIYGLEGAPPELNSLPLKNDGLEDYFPIGSR